MRAPRIIATAIALAIALAGALSCNAAQAGEFGEFWDSLWRNADQRGEQLLQQGDAAAAARTYADPRRKAYAELQAGNNAAAASDLAPFDDSDAHYNRGNALARNGDLKPALQAYDAALARDPQNHDAQHNRDLVAKALRDQQQTKQQQSQQQDGGEPPSSDPQKSSPNSDPADAAAKKDQPPPDKSQQHAEIRPPGDSHHSREKPQDSAADDEQQAGRSEQSRTAPAPSKDDAKDEAGQAQRDAQDALQRRDSHSDSDRGATRDASEQQAMTEQQLAEEQWLRQIPDDPGGLLRRKFMIEHMLRHQQQPEPFNSR